MINTIESGDFARIEHDVYLRGYLVSYARLLSVPSAEVELHLRERAPAQPVLIATRRVSHSRYLFERYSVPAVYVILTGLIVAPAVWLASHGGLEQNLARLAPLDSPAADTGAPIDGETSALAGSTTASGNPSAIGSSVATPGSTLAPTPSEAPLMASLAPFPPMTTAEPATPAAAAPLPRGTYDVVLTLNEASWVEIITKNGERIEYKLLPAGSRREYSVDQPVTVRLGNATGASVRVNGEPVDIVPHRRANVARFQLSSGGASPPPPES